MGSGKARKRTSDARNPHSERMAKCRARRAAGRRVYKVEADEAALELALVELGYLRHGADDPKAIELALSQMLERLLDNARDGFL